MSCKTEVNCEGHDAQRQLKGSFVMKGWLKALAVAVLRSPVRQGCGYRLFTFVVLRVQQLPGGCRPGLVAYPFAVQAAHTRVRVPRMCCAAATIGIESFQLFQQLRSGLACRRLGLAAAIEAACRVKETRATLTQRSAVLASKAQAAAAFVSLSAAPQAAGSARNRRCLPCSTFHHPAAGMYCNIKVPHHSCTAPEGQAITST
jgi:hypothetical protein